MNFKSISGMVGYKDKIITVRLTQDLYNKLCKVAFAKRVSVSALIRYFITHEVERMLDEMGDLL